MWFLVIILTVFAPEGVRVQQVNVRPDIIFPTYELCAVLQLSVDEGMKEAPPDEMVKYRIRCVSPNADYPPGTPIELQELK